MRGVSLPMFGSGSAEYVPMTRDGRPPVGVIMVSVWYCWSVQVSPLLMRHSLQALPRNHSSIDYCPFSSPLVSSLESIIPLSYPYTPVNPSPYPPIYQ